MTKIERIITRSILAFIDSIISRIALDDMNVDDIIKMLKKKRNDLENDLL